MNADAINALPEHVRDYIHALVTNTDPSGMVRENTQLRDTNEGLQRMYRRAADELEQARVYAERYAWLREQSWFDGQLCVIRNPKTSLAGKLTLGCDCPSLTRLDKFIDDAKAGKDIT